MFRNFTVFSLWQKTCSSYLMWPLWCHLLSTNRLISSLVRFLQNERFQLMRALSYNKRTWTFIYGFCFWYLTLTFWHVKSCLKCVYFSRRETLFLNFLVNKSYSKPKMTDKEEEIKDIDYDDPQYRITPFQQAAASCTGALITSLLGISICCFQVFIKKLIINELYSNSTRCCKNKTSVSTKDSATK